MKNKIEKEEKKKKENNIGFHDIHTKTFCSIMFISYSKLHVKSNHICYEKSSNFQMF